MRLTGNTAQDAILVPMYMGRWGCVRENALGAKKQWVEHTAADIRFDPALAERLNEALRQGKAIYVRGGPE